MTTKQKNNLFQVYCIQNNLNGKIYLGKTNNLSKRLSRHKNGRVNEKRSLITQAIKKYGFDNFSYFTIEFFENEDEAYEAEEFWVTLLESKTPNGYNLTSGGCGQKAGVFSGSKHPMYGKKQTKKTIKKMKDGIKKFLTENPNTRKESSARRMEKEGPEVIKHLANIRDKFLEENPDHFSKITKASWADPVIRNKIIEKMYKKITCTNLVTNEIIEFKSLTAASEYTGVSIKAISENLNGRSKTCFKKTLKFNYV